METFVWILLTIFRFLQNLTKEKFGKITFFVAEYRLLASWFLVVVNTFEIYVENSHFANNKLNLLLFYVKSSNIVFLLIKY